MIKNRKIENRKKIGKLKIGKNRKIGKYRKIEIFQNLIPNHGANERPKGEPVAAGDLKAS